MSDAHRIETGEHDNPGNGAHEAGQSINNDQVSFRIDPRIRRGFNIGTQHIGTKSLACS